MSSNENEWKRLATVPVPSNSISWSQYSFTMCSYYIDVNDKEWIIILLPPLWHMNSKYPNSYLYDVENDQVIPFIKHYVKDINEAFNIIHVDPKSGSTSFVRTNADNDQYMSYVVDNDNHVLYWLHSQNQQSSLISIDIKDLQNIQLIDQTILSSQSDTFENVIFCDKEYTMLISGDTIQFILGTKDNYSDYDDSLANFQFNIKTKEFCVIHNNIHVPQSVDHVAKFKIEHLLDNLKIDDYIDVKDHTGRWYLAKVLNIRNVEFYSDKAMVDNMNKNANGSKVAHADKGDLIIKSMGIFVHYVRWPSRWDQWIHVSSDQNMHESEHFDQFQKKSTPAEWKGVTKEYLISRLKNASSLCDCPQECQHNFFEDYLKRARMYDIFGTSHRIALPKTQSLYNKSLYNLKGLYCKKNQTMVVLGRNSKHKKDAAFGGVYCKRIHSKPVCELIVNGFIHRLKNDENCSDTSSNISKAKSTMYIPKDLRALILKYYMQYDKQWKYVTKIGEDGKLIEADHDENLCTRFQYVVVNNNNINIDDKYSDKDIMIYVFRGKIGRGDFGYDRCLIGRIDIDTQANIYSMRVLSKVQSPTSRCLYWHVIFCAKSRTIHLFEDKFEMHYSISLETLNKPQIFAWS